MPSRNETNINIEKALLITCIMTGIKIDVGEIIFRELGIRANQKQALLPFPCLITALFQAASVPPMLKHEKIDKALKDIDIMQISDAEEKETETPAETHILPPIHIDVPSNEESGDTEESDKGDSRDEETDEEALGEDTKGHQDKGKQVAVYTRAEDEEEAALQIAIAHSLADMVAKAHPSTTQPTPSEASNSQAPALASQEV